MTHFPNKQVIENSDRSKLNSQQEIPLVSVIIPSYNHAHLVGEAIKSVLEQDYQHYEIILVDDGSTDNTCEVVAQFGFKVRYIYQPNQGLSAARNSGLYAARGELVGFLDADDLYEPNFISTLISILEANPQADAVHCACRFVDRFNNPLPQIAGKVVTAEHLFSTMLKGNFLTPVCMFAYKYCYEETGGFDRAFQGVADWDMWLRISKSFTVIATEQVLARYRVTPYSMSTDIESMLEDRLNVLAKHVGTKPSARSSLSNEELESYSRVYLRAAVEYLQTGDQGQAYKCFYQALHLYPPLVEQLDIFYELAWGCTPRGYRGDFSALDLTHNAQVLVSMLDEMFSNKQLPFELKQYRKRSYANAYLVLSQLSYGKGEYQKARKHWLRGVRRNFQAVFLQPYLLIFIKTIIGVNIINYIKAWKLSVLRRDLNFLRELIIRQQ
jgi:glycosyltransferase involved in cell wall biosynthesis